MRDVQRGVRLDHNIFGKRPILGLRCVARTGASVQSELDKLILVPLIGLSAPAYAIAFLEICQTVEIASKRAHCGRGHFA